MKHIFIVLLVFLAIVPSWAQKHEIGVFLGTSNGITDIGRTDYVNPFPKDFEVGKPTVPFNVGLLYRFNLNPFHSLRANLHYTKFIDNDKLAAEDYRFEREVKFSQTLIEGSVVFEYNFLPINAEQRTGHSPYIFAGLGAFAYNHPTYTVTNYSEDGIVTSATDFESVISKENELKFSYTIPFGAGYKYKFNYNWQAGIELGFRPTFVDDLDMAFAQEEDFTFQNEVGLTSSFPGIDEEINRSNSKYIMERQLGDTSNRDWYVFAGMHITYVFGRPACFCD